MSRRRIGLIFPTPNRISSPIADSMTPREVQRYVVKIECFPIHDPAQLTEADLDQDHMEAVSQLLRDSEDGQVDADRLEPIKHNFRFDLCPECREKFVRDPLSKEAAQKF